MFKVIKRDGRVKEFDMHYIERAISNAYYEVYNDAPSKPSRRVRLMNIIERLAVRFSRMNESELRVERIQDIIIDHLRREDIEVAVAYSNYRVKRNKIRESKSELINNISSIIENTNDDVFKENANKHAQLASTQRDLIAGEVSKTIARIQIPEHLMKAHDSGLIKIHDLDYYMQGIYNCELVNLEDMFQNGTVINKKLIEKPKSLRTAMTLATQIAAQIACCTYGGQTMSLSHIAPFVRISEQKIRNKIIKRSRMLNLDLSDYKIEQMVALELADEVRDAVQTFNYQISTIMCTNGQTPFISVCMYISENPEYERETVILIEEFLRQRMEGMKNENGVAATQTFPKLLYFLDENNTYEGSEYFWLTELAVKSTSMRMNPDYISVKKMREIVGHVFPPMGCRAFLSPFLDKNGKWIFYGRGNLGAQTINLPYVALESGGDIDKFWEGLASAVGLVREMCRLRYDKLKGVKAGSAPILWQHGAISRLNHDDDITKAIDERGFTVTIGYSGIYETVKYLTGESHTSEKGFELAEEIMSYLKQCCEVFKVEEPHLRYALYGTPQEATTGWFNDKLVKKFGIVKDITDKGWITNSYHVDIREDIDAFSKLSLESKLQAYSTGGAVSYIETINMNKNLEALMDVVQFMYEEILYSEINFESDVCGQCSYEGVMDNDPETLDWVCPSCGNRDQKTLSVVRRTCGYLGETVWTDGRKLDILNRTKHL